MAEIIEDRDYLLSENERLAVKVIKVSKEDSPFGYKVKFQFMVFKYGKWDTVVRVDNTRHKSKVPSLHIHRIDKEKVEEIEMHLWDVGNYVIKLGRKLKHLL